MIINLFPAVSFVCISVLLNLAEDIHTERKMVKRKIVVFLAKVSTFSIPIRSTYNLTEEKKLFLQMLDRVSPELVILTIVFLKKLSIFEENKDAMVELTVVDKLLRYVRCDHDKTVQTALKLLFNLSFDPALRELLVKNSLIPKLVELLKRPPFRALSLRILYHLSMDDRCKSMFTYTEAIPIVLQLVLNFPQNLVAKELASLAVNLSLNARNAELMCQNRGLEALATRVFRTRDPLLLKVVRNISIWSYTLQEDLASDKQYKYRGMWASLVTPLLELCLAGDASHDVMLEALATLANLTPSDLPTKAPWDRLISEHALLPFLSKLLVPGFSQDDVVLEVVLLVGALALEPKCAPLIASSRILRSLHALFQEKQHDSELTLQLLFTLYRLMRHRETYEELLYGGNGGGIVPDLLMAADAPNIEVRRMCDMLMDLIVDRDSSEAGVLGEFARLIRQRRFEIYNAEYLEILHESANGRGGRSMGIMRADVYDGILRGGDEKLRPDDDDDDDLDDE